LPLGCGLYDSATGLVRFGVRDYDPHVGRWTAKDPILFEGGQSNFYVFANNDPVNRVDPTGYRDCDSSERCHDNCMDGQNVVGLLDVAKAGVGVSAPFTSLPKLGRAGRIARYAKGQQPFSTVTSWIGGVLKRTGASAGSRWVGFALKNFNRKINPYANVIMAGSAAYWATSRGICRVHCAF
jgi:RHS repeat-associated protein